MRKFIITVVLSFIVVGCMILFMFVPSVFVASAEESIPEWTQAVEVYKFNSEWSLMLDYSNDVDRYPRYRVKFSKYIDDLAYTAGGWSGYSYSSSVSVDIPNDVAPYLCRTWTDFNSIYSGWGSMFGCEVNGVYQPLSAFISANNSGVNFPRLFNAVNPIIVTNNQRLDLYLGRKYTGHTTSTYSNTSLGIAVLRNSDFVPFHLDFYFPTLPFIFNDKGTIYGSLNNAEFVGAEYVYIENSIGVYLFSPKIYSDFSLSSDVGMVSFFTDVEVYNPNTNYIYHKFSDFRTVSAYDFNHGYSESIFIGIWTYYNWDAGQIYGKYFALQDVLVYLHAVTNTEGIVSKYAVRARVNMAYCTSENWLNGDGVYSADVYLLPRMSTDEDVEGELLGLIPSIMGAFTDFFITTFGQMSIFGVSILTILVTIIGVGLVVMIIKMIRG